MEPLSQKSIIFQDSYAFHIIFWLSHQWAHYQHFYSVQGQEISPILSQYIAKLQSTNQILKTTRKRALHIQSNTTVQPSCKFKMALRKLRQCIKNYKSTIILQIDVMLSR